MSAIDRETAERILAALDGRVHGKWVLSYDGQETDCIVEVDEEQQVTTVTPTEPVVIPPGGTFTIGRHVIISSGDMYETGGA